jgi:hypothetical protein
VKSDFVLQDQPDLQTFRTLSILFCYNCVPVASFLGARSILFDGKMRTLGWLRIYIPKFSRRQNSIVVLGRQTGLSARED